jgi:N-methylhydantoinase A/oxoprolinase/acetone carboxylase beta subunit
MQGMMTLPPIVQSASAAAGGGSAAGSKVSSFSVVPQSGVETRITNANLYGIGSLG